MLNTIIKHLKQIKCYLIEINEYRKKYPHTINYLRLVSYFNRWRINLEKSSSALTNDMPWLPYAVIDYLNKTLNKSMTVYEFSSGGSTLFFSKRVNQVISVEHNPDWYNAVMNEIKKVGCSNCKLSLIEPVTDSNLSENFEDPDSYRSSDEIYKGMSFENYAKSIERYPDNYFDIVLIDGRARPSCLKHSFSKVKINGYLILDNAERNEYGYIHRFLDNEAWIKKVFFGPAPYMPYFWETCVWVKVHD